MKGPSGLKMLCKSQLGSAINREQTDLCILVLSQEQAACQAPGPTGCLSLRCDRLAQLQRCIRGARLLKQATKALSCTDPSTASFRACSRWIFKDRCVWCFKYHMQMRFLKNSIKTAVGLLNIGTRRSMMFFYPAIDDRTGLVSIGRTGIFLEWICGESTLEAFLGPERILCYITVVSA